MFDGLSYRNYFRATTRRVVELHERHGVLLLEFRAFDTCANTRLLEALLNLFCGFLLDESLPGRLSEQDPERLKLSSIKGFDDPSLRQEGLLILHAPQAALDQDESLVFLKSMLLENDSYARRMKDMYAETGSVMKCISGQYDYN